ncbi:hypothetical protein GQX73_g5720 [Xylaria multiplex]|uniref:Uncharacterized protein n=1 Tax=Xylaria multiplex TaxID=323545 RepID=A0A7C8MXC0_9PEZI|nr:hypothetical protein GQX73_g5720 [Xylaria multiplex]
MLHRANYRDGSNLSARSSTPDRGCHTHSAGFSHEPRTKRSKSRYTVHKPRYSEQHQRYLEDSYEELVESTPRQDAGVDEVRTWVLEVFHRRCHPDPEGALNGFHWKGRDLHSQRRYLALRLRFRGEPYGYMIAHDIHDAIKESRRRAHKRQKEARRQIKKAMKTDGKTAPISGRTPTAQTSPPSTSLASTEGGAPSQGKSNIKAQKGPLAIANINTNHEAETSHLIGDNEPQDAGAGTARVRNKLVKIFTNGPRTCSGAAAITVMSPSGVEDPFRDPIPGPQITKPKPKPKKAKKKGKALVSLESPGSSQNPFLDPEPMRLIDADDFRLDSPEDTNWPSTGPPYRWLPGFRKRESGDGGKRIRDRREN